MLSCTNTRTRAWQCYASHAQTYTPAWQCYHTQQHKCQHTTRAHTFADTHTQQHAHTHTHSVLLRACETLCGLLLSSFLNLFCDTHEVWIVNNKATFHITYTTKLVYIVVEWCANTSLCTCYVQSADLHHPQIFFVARTENPSFAQENPLESALCA